MTTVIAGKNRDKQASWDPDTGDLSGDPAIVALARSADSVQLHAEGDRTPIDWKDAKTAIPALVEAANEVYGPETVIAPSEVAPVYDEDFVLYGR